MSAMLIKAFLVYNCPTNGHNSEQTLNLSIPNWVVARVSEKVSGETLLSILSTLWTLAEALREIAEEKLTFVCHRAKAQGVTLTIIATSCKKKNCYCKGKPLHFPYVRMLKGGAWEEVKRAELPTFLANFLDKSDVENLLAICNLRNKVLRIYSRLGNILVTLGVVEA